MSQKMHLISAFIPTSDLKQLEYIHHLCPPEFFSLIDGDEFCDEKIKRKKAKIIAQQKPSQQPHSQKKTVKNFKFVGRVHCNQTSY